MLGDGRPVDLHKLYCVVSEKGGYDSVTVIKAWPMVAEAIGLGSSLGCPLKLIYAKYLDALEHCLQRFPAKKVVEDAHQGSVENLGLSPNDLEMDAGGFLKKILKMKKESVADTMPLCSKRDHFLTAASENEQMLLSSNVECDKLADFGKNSETRVFSSLKRKRDALVGMLSWERLIQEVLKGADNLINEQYSHALQARKALFLKKIRRADIDRSPFQKAEKMNSSINGDVVCSSLQSSRCNQHSHSLEKTCNSCCSKMFIDGVQEKDENHTAVRSEALHEKRKLRIFVLFPDYLTDCIPNRIPLGPSFQAKVPTWLGEQPVDDSDDLKWLGSCIWPYQDHEKSSSTKHDAIGKGREEHCGCRNPGSLKCVRFHVAEKRLQLKRELGPVFYAWRFQCMGEEVALSWKEEEERKFEETVRLNTPSNSRNLWKQLHLLFPSKETEVWLAIISTSSSLHVEAIKTE
ncbi:hypothetical protein HPP92_022589 [Vanilla planifolia]|uniref:ARID domain-containing protein n=1 Tax=Vanilla planifolia TaxID=51239 RepID=A0A835UDC4_VANPL|nr:hypothetical protein HPP92_022589 [Vanilla planifolia]